jgi:hypothetical protein
MSAKALTRFLAVIGLGILTIWVYHPRFAEHTIRVGGFESTALAQSIADHGEFSNPFHPLDTGPSAHLAPLYPAYLALFIKAFRSDSAVGDALVWASLLELALQLMLLPILAEGLGLGFWTGVVAGLAWIFAGIPPMFLWESTLAAVLIVYAALLMQRSFSPEMSRSELVISGLVWGALLLLQPVVIAVLPFWLLLLHFRSHRSLGQKIVLALLPLVIVAPWMVRNFLVFHRPVFIRDNLGLELAVSNNDCASPLFETNDQRRCFESTHPNVNYQEALKVRDMGEVAYNRVRMKEATDWIRANPGQFALLTVERFEVFWLPPQVVNHNNGMVWNPRVLQLFTLLSIPGIILMWRNSPVAAWILGLWLVFFPSIYYFIQFMDRYRYPILWATFLAGSYFIVEMARGLAGLQPAVAAGKETNCLPGDKVA